MRSELTTGRMPVLALIALLGCSGATAEAPSARQRPATSGRDSTTASTSPSLSQRDDGATRRTTLLPSGVRQIDISAPQQYWRASGFRRLAPVIQPSLPSLQLELTIYLQLPPRGAIEVTASEDGIPRLVWPAGTQADRVSYARSAAGELFVADVRGSRIDEQGNEHFHVYRPAEVGRQRVLRGYEWRRDDASQRARAHDLIIEQVRHTPRGPAEQVPTASYLEHFTRLMNCEACHQANKPAAEDAEDWLPLWPTDSIGWYVPQSVMRASAELSTSEDFHDPNAHDAFVSGRCPSGEARIHARGEVRWFSCLDGSVPRGERNVRAALKAGDAYSRALCQSRQWLMSRMSSGARAHFAELALECSD